MLAGRNLLWGMEIILKSIWKVGLKTVQRKIRAGRVGRTVNYKN